MKHTLNTTWVTSKPDKDLFPTVLNPWWHQWPLAHATSMVLNKTQFQKGQTSDYTISTFYICTGPILWVKGSMIGTDRAHKRPSPLWPWARRLCNSHIAGWALTKEGPIKQREWLQTRSGVMAGHAPRITQHNHRECQASEKVFDQFHRSGHRTKSASKHLHAFLLTLEDHGLGPRALIGGRAADAQHWLAERWATAWLPKMAADFDDLPAGCHQNNPTDLHFTHRDNLHDTRWGS